MQWLRFFSSTCFIPVRLAWALYASVKRVCRRSAGMRYGSLTRPVQDVSIFVHSQTGC